ncbi:MAG: hypothetical protein HRU70_11945 [Phycisphaeraceae bacterium]|jgi:membrane protein DedA with SNARE-associated domain|nr:MAG: hypothetical protein HRU70_11945 [Phycisphaeraceae bacterium]
MHIIDPRRLGFALGATLAVLHLGCAVVMALVPKDAALHFANALVHGLDFGPVLTWDKTWTQTATGAFCVFVLGWLLGATIAAIYNLTGPPRPTATPRGTAHPSGGESEKP